MVCGFSISSNYSTNNISNINYDNSNNNNNDNGNSNISNNNHDYYNNSNNNLDNKCNSYIFNCFSGNNRIDFNEFLLLVKNYEKPLSEEQEIREMFNAIDTDHNGYIDLDELKATFTKLGVPLTDKDVKDMMKEAGVEGSRIFYEGE